MKGIKKNCTNEFWKFRKNFLKRNLWNVHWHYATLSYFPVISIAHLKPNTINTVSKHRHSFSLSRCLNIPITEALKGTLPSPDSSTHTACSTPLRWKALGKCVNIACNQTPSREEWYDATSVSLTNFISK